jgi:hypothetical protein
LERLKHLAIDGEDRVVEYEDLVSRLRELQGEFSGEKGGFVTLEFFVESQNMRQFEYTRDYQVNSQIPLKVLVTELEKEMKKLNIFLMQILKRGEVLWPIQND